MRIPTVVLLTLTAVGCTSKAVLKAPPPPMVPLPGNALAGQSVAVWPVNAMTADSALGWGESLVPPREARAKADSVLAQILQEVRPMVRWVPPEEVRQAAKQAPGMLTEPDQMATSLLQTHALTNVQDPLRSQLRQLTAVATGGRYALVPANLSFVRAANGTGRADLSVALVDVRLGAVSWSATGSGEGRSPWEAMTRAVRALTQAVGM